MSHLTGLTSRAAIPRVFTCPARLNLIGVQASTGSAAPRPPCVPSSPKKSSNASASASANAAPCGAVAWGRSSSQKSSTKLQALPGAVVASISATNYVIAGDIGGTNARLQVWVVSENHSSELVFEKIYPTKDFASFPDVLEQMQSECPDIKITSAAFAVAGAVVDQVCVMTNLGWEVNGPALEDKFGYKVSVLNDFEAVGYGVRNVDPSSILIVNDAPPVEKAPIAVLGPGTGLGEAQMMWEESQGTYKVYPSEGSHADFAPRGWKQRALSQFIEHQLGYCEVESVGCGSGLERIYAFLTSDEGPHSEELHDIFNDSIESGSGHLGVQKEAPEISKAALAGTDPIAREAVDIMLSIIGAEAGHMALRALTRGGVYIAGGITPKVIDRLQFGGLKTAFLSRKGRFSGFLQSVPLYVVLDDKVGLLGSKTYAIQMLRNL